MQTLDLNLLAHVPADHGNRDGDDFDLLEDTANVDDAKGLCEAIEDFDLLGIGAVTVDDIAGLEFIDRFRRQMPEIPEAYAFHGRNEEYFSLAYDA